MIIINNKYISFDPNQRNDKDKSVMQHIKPKEANQIFYCSRKREAAAGAHHEFFYCIQLEQPARSNINM